MPHDPDRLAVLSCSFSAIRRTSHFSGENGGRGFCNVTAVGAGPGRLKTAVWIVWLISVTSATFPLFLWHVRYFQHPGTKYLTLLLIAVCAVTAWLPLYHRLRQ